LLGLVSAPAHGAGIDRPAEGAGEALLWAACLLWRFAGPGERCTLGDRKSRVTTGAMCCGAANGLCKST
jgi:hypothetical protein